MIAAGETKTIIYVYTKAAQGTATINVVHKDITTEAILKQDAFKVPDGAYGPYNASSFNGYGAGVLAIVSTPASGTIANGETKTITYMYTKSTNNEAIIFVVHKAGETGAILKQGIYMVTAGAYGPYNASSFKGYSASVLATDSAPASGKIAAGEIKIITYIYS
jgi:hypothetical protein